MPPEDRESPPFEALLERMTGELRRSGAEVIAEIEERFSRGKAGVESQAASRVAACTAIDENEPASWRDLQERTARILREVGVEAEVEKTITTARGTVAVDVWARDDAATPPQTYLVECKRWRSSVPKAIVHSFRTVVGDSGANWGAIVSTRGFQRGARAAAQYTNVRLLTWAEFQELFRVRWYTRHFLRVVGGAQDALHEYTEPINSRIFRKADALPAARREEFKALRREHFPLASFCMFLALESEGILRTFVRQRYAIDLPDAAPTLPLRVSMKGAPLALPAPILDARSLRGLLAAVLAGIQEATEAFESVFGERA